MEALFPYGIGIDAEGRVAVLGSGLRRRTGACGLGLSVAETLRVQRGSFPGGAPELGVVRADVVVATWIPGNFTVRGPVLVVEDADGRTLWWYAASPFARNIEQLQTWGIRFQDLPLSDPTVDYLFVIQTLGVALADSTRLNMIATKHASDLATVRHQRHVERLAQAGFSRAQRRAIARRFEELLREGGPFSAGELRSVMHSVDELLARSGEGHGWCECDIREITREIEDRVSLAHINDDRRLFTVVVSDDVPERVVLNPTLLRHLLRNVLEVLRPCHDHPDRTLRIEWADDEIEIRATVGHECLTARAIDALYGRDVGPVPAQEYHLHGFVRRLALASYGHVAVSAYNDRAHTVSIRLPSATVGAYLTETSRAMPHRPLLIAVAGRGPRSEAARRMLASMRHDSCEIEDERVARADAVFVVYERDHPPAVPEPVIADAVPKLLFVHPDDERPGIQSKYAADRTVPLPFKRSVVVEILEELSAHIHS